MPELKLSIHLSSQILTVVPSPTSFHVPLSNRFNELYRLCHNHEAPFFSFESKILLLGKYLLFITLLTNRLGLVRILQPCLANKALLKQSKSLKPSPPYFFLSARSVHFFQCIFCFPWSFPHQNLAIIALKSLHKFLDSLKTDIACEGRASAIDLSNTSFLTLLNSFPFQL